MPLEPCATPANGRSFRPRITVSDTRRAILGDIFAIKRGLATGSNSFFILTEEEIKESANSAPVYKADSSRPAPPDRQTSLIALPSGAPDVSPRLYLIDCNEPEERIKANWPRFYEYLQTGRAQKIHASYLDQPPRPVVFAGTAPSRAVPLHVHGPLPQWQASLPLYLEPLPGDRPQRLSDALSHRPSARRTEATSRACTRMSLRRSSASPQTAHRRRQGVRGRLAQSRTEGTGADSRAPRAGCHQDARAHRGADANVVYVAVE